MTIEKRRRAAKPGTLPAFTPVPRQCARHDGWTPDRQRQFIEALADTGSVRAAAHAVNMAPEGAYALRRHPEAGPFRQAWEAALACGVQRLEDIAMDRATNGVEVPVYSYGKLIGTRVVFNDRLLMFLLRNRAPARFATGAHGTQRRLGDPAEANRMARAKARWRKEWDAERAAVEEADEQQTLDEIDQFLDQRHQAYLAAMTTQTRALYDAFTAAHRADAEAGRSSYTEAEQDAPPQLGWHGAEEDALEGVDAPAPPEDGMPHRRKAALPEEDWPRVGPKGRGLKDDGWG